MLDVNGLSIRIAHSFTEDAHLRGARRASSLFETLFLPTPCSAETGPSASRASRQSPQHPDEHRPERPVLLAIDQAGIRCGHPGQRS